MKKLNVNGVERKASGIRPIPNVEKSTNNKANFMLKNGVAPYFLAYVNGVPSQFLFDTGNANTELDYNFYIKNKDAIDKVAIKDSITGGGFGFVRKKEILRIPSFDMTIGNKNAQFKNIMVSIDNNNDQSESDGNMGMDLVLLFDKTRINFKDMVISFE